MRLAIMQSFQQPLTDSVFPLTEKLLEAPGCYEAVKDWLGKDKIDLYVSLMDCLFCEVFPEYQEVCFDFYNRKSLSLIEKVSNAELELFDKMLLEVAKLALVSVVSGCCLA